MFATTSFQTVTDELRMVLGYTLGVSPGVSSHQVSLAETTFIVGVCVRT
jgi:hypothetical protein